jgi:uncharacterized repeat protein (TIGR02543 family)
MKNKKLVAAMLGKAALAAWLAWGLGCAGCVNLTADNGGKAETTYTVSYSVGLGTGAAPASQTAKEGTVITLPYQGSMAAPSGQIFYGWLAGSSIYPAGTSYTVQGDITFTAQWRASGDNPGGATSGLYMGIIGFNENINAKEISPLHSSTKNAFQSFVNAMETRAGTVLYYAVENALDKLAQASLPNDLVNVSIVTFTDGLDQGSVMLNETYGGSNAAYLAAIGNRIQTSKIKNLNISAYSIGIKGSDVSDMTQFKANLNSIASSSANAYELTSMAQVETKFQDIANSLYNESSEQIIRLEIPGQADGTKIRFTFDNVNDAKNSTLYIEGTFSFAIKTLTDIVYKGCSSSSGTTIAGIQNGIFVSFSFSNLMLTSGSSVPINAIKQWRQPSGATNWQKNDEFAYDPKTIITVERKSAIIMLVLDCSSSLGTSGFNSIKSSANSFINTLIQENSNDDPEPATCSVTFNADVGSPTPDSRTVVSGSSLGSLPTEPTRTGHTFGGWFTQTNGGGTQHTSSSTITGDITLYAKWTANTPTYTVTFNADGGSPTPDSRTVVSGNALGPLPAAPTRAGYAFGGWFSDQNGGGIQFADSTIITANTTLHAKWTFFQIPSNYSLDESLAWIDNNAAEGGDYAVVLKSNETIAPKTFSYGGKKVSITLNGESTERRVSLSSTGSLFTVESGVTLTLGRNVTLRGRNDNELGGSSSEVVRIRSGGTLVMKDGAKITGNKASTYGGGVGVYGGAFVMDGGTISDNYVGDGGGGGAGVYLWPSDSDSELSSFIMNGGIITNNTTEGRGAGVLAHGSNFIMNNGTISNNTAGYGGGVYSSSFTYLPYSGAPSTVTTEGSFAMNGGKISGNSATSSYVNLGGGGVYAADNTFAMSGGEISGNSASYGGGVYVSGAFTMRGGTISGNSASSSGGGVYVSGAITMRGGTISGNTASYSGGGVSVGYNGTFTKQTNGIIYGSSSSGTLRNTAMNGDSYGHAVYVYSGQKKRTTTAGSGLFLNSSASGTAGGWE